MKGLMWKLLRKHISAGQLIGFSIANLIGLAIVMIAVQFYRDVKPIFADEDSFISKDYLVISKHVDGIGMASAGEFTSSDVADIESQPWTRAVGEFVTAHYHVGATVGVGGTRSMSTQLFFESIPDQFIDVATGNWKFVVGSGEIPVILSREYLALYNFGYATAQSMPQISESMASMIPLSFTLSGNGNSVTMRGRIVGFSNRLNSVIVPQDFMRWSNERFGSGEDRNPSRLIVEVNSPGDVKIEQFMNEHRYDIAGDKMNSSKANYFLVVVIGIVIAVGVIISLLSFFVLMLSIYLLLQKNTRKLQDLLWLGYSPAQVSRPYIAMVVTINCCVLVLAALVVLIARLYYMPMLTAFGVQGVSIVVSIAVGVAIMAVITIGNIAAIKRKVNSLWLM